MKRSMSVLFLVFSMIAFAIWSSAAFAAPPDRMGGHGYGDRQNNRGKSGTCPAGTCSMSGTSHANNLNLCKASNCKSSGSK